MSEPTLTKLVTYIDKIVSGAPCITANSTTNHWHRKKLHFIYNKNKSTELFTKLLELYLYKIIQFSGYKLSSESILKFSESIPNCWRKIFFSHP